MAKLETPPATLPASRSVLPSQGASSPASPPVGFNWAGSRDVVVTIIGSAVILYVLGSILAHIMQIVLIFVLSVVVAFILEPLVDRLQRFRIARGWATAGVYASFILALAGALVWIGGGVATQLTLLNQQLPQYETQLQQQEIPVLQAWLNGHGVPVDLSQIQRDAGTALGSIGGQVITNGLSIAAGVTDLLVNFVLVVVISLYLVLDGSKIRDNLASLVPPKRQRLFRFMEASLVHVLGGYIRGQFTMAAIISVSAGLGCWLLGVHYALVIGVLAFFFELIPMVGPVLTAVPAVIISLFQPFPLVLIVIGFFVIVQMVESNVLGPRITGHAVGLHPIASILALVGGAEVAGLWGALFAVPLVGLVVVLAMAAYNELRDRSPEEVIRPRAAWKFVLPRRKPGAQPLGE